MNRNQKISSYFSDGTQTVYEYSPSGNLLHVTGETGTISYSYNKAGLLVESENINSTKEPSKNSFLDTCVSIFQNLF